MLDDRYYVETPEVVAIAYDVAGLGSRCVAAAVDTLLILVLQAGLGAAVLGFATLLGGALDEATNLLLALWALLAFLLLWGYYLLFELLWSGQSPGKRLVGLRVIREGGRPVDFSASAVRNLVRAVDFVPFAYGLGVLTMFADTRARRLGDFAAGTLVVREGRPLALADLARGATPAPVPPRPADAPPTPLIANLHLLRPEERELAEAFLRRREGLSPARRGELAARIAAALRARLALPQGGDPERFIEHLVREHRVFQELEARAAHSG
jgi:uncharacterized RDD family membrane protein YckC